MKKALIGMLVAFASVSVNAASLAWGSSSYLYDGTTQMTSNNGYAITGYLVYLGNATATWDSTGFDIKTFSESPSDFVSTKGANALGTVSTKSGNPVVAVGATIPNTTASLVDGGSNFGVVYLATGFTDNKTHYIQSDVFTFSTSDSNYDAAKDTFTMSLNAAKADTSAWQAVPEPNVALMGLLGLGMLLKRRKA